MICYKITLVGGGTYVQPESELRNALDAETDGMEVGDSITLQIAKIEIDDKEYNKLPEFTGH